MIDAGVYWGKRDRWDRKDTRDQIMIRSTRQEGIVRGMGAPVTQLTPARHILSEVVFSHQQHHLSSPCFLWEYLGCDLHGYNLCPPTQAQANLKFEI